MMFMMRDGTGADLIEILQVSQYREGYLQRPSDPHAECLRLAAYHVPQQWRSAPLIFLWPDEYGSLSSDLLVAMKLPKILCLGRFSSHRPPASVNGKVSYLHIAWVQESFAPHIPAEVLRCMERLDWDTALRSR